MLKNLDIECVSGHFTLRVCGEIAPCWSGPCHVHARRSSPLAMGVVRGQLASGAVFYEYGQTYTYLYVHFAGTIIK